MKEGYIAHHDSGDENDYWTKEADRIASREYTGLDDDPVFHEQIAIALRVMDEADTLPVAIVDYHRKLLEYWGIVESSDNGESKGR